VTIHPLYSNIGTALYIPAACGPKVHARRGATINGSDLPENNLDTVRRTVARTIQKTYRWLLVPGRELDAGRVSPDIYTGDVADPRAGVRSRRRECTEETDRETRSTRDITIPDRDAYRVTARCVRGSGSTGMGGERMKETA
jgi:hypothetical protein